MKYTLKKYYKEVLAQEHLSCKTFVIEFFFRGKPLEPFQVSNFRKLPWFVTKDKNFTLILDQENIRILIDINDLRIIKQLKYYRGI